jgi:hypothetical protein
MAGKKPKMVLLHDPERDVLEINGVEVDGEVLRLLVDPTTLGRIYRLMPGPAGRRSLDELEYDENFGLSAKKQKRA